MTPAFAISRHCEKLHCKPLTTVLRCTPRSVSLTEDPEFEIDPCSRLANLGHTAATEVQIGASAACNFQQQQQLYSVCSRALLKCWLPQVRVQCQPAPACCAGTPPAGALRPGTCSALALPPHHNIAPHRAGLGRARVQGGARHARLQPPRRRPASAAGGRRARLPLAAAQVGLGSRRLKFQKN